MDSLAATLERSPELFPYALDVAGDLVSLIRLSEADYARASFLDARAVSPRTATRAMPWPPLHAAVSAANLPEDCGFIFHIGHVGSTLLSRLLGAHPQVFALREPAILRTLAQLHSDPGIRPGEWSEAEFDLRLTAFLKLWSRTFRPEQHAILKATSFASELAAQILARPSAPKAIFMFVPAETYLASILGAPNSPKEARMLAESRLARLRARLGEERWRLASLGEGEMVAMSWACEMTALSAAVDVAGDRVLWINFERFLDDSSGFLAAAFSHFGIKATGAEVDSILRGRDMHRYSKAPEHAYDARLRNDVLNQARREHASEIARGAAWLSAAAAEFPILNSVLKMS